MSAERIFTVLPNKRGEQGLDIIGANLESGINVFNQWKANPQQVFKNSLPSSFSYLKFQAQLYAQYRELVEEYGLSSSTATIQDRDVKLAREIIHGIKTGPWNPSMVVHSEQVGVYAKALSRNINFLHPDLQLDDNRMEVKGLFHDIGRSVTHHPVVHAFAGREILKLLGVSADIRTSNLSDNEAGVGPYISFISPETWANIDSEEGSIDNLVANLPLEEVLIALADMGKRDINNVKYICDPIEGLVPSAINRLKTNTFMPTAEILMPLAAATKDDRDAAQATLRQAGLNEGGIKQMAMYFGWAGALKRRVEQLGVTFEGEDGVVAEAKNNYEAMVAARSI